MTPDKNNAHYIATFHSPLTLAELVSALAYDDRWGVFWLNNAHRPVIGILPNTSFLLTQLNGQISLTISQHGKCQTTACDWASYQHQLQSYIDKHQNTTANATDGYVNGLLGYVSYDIAAAALTNHPCQNAGQVLAFFAHFDIYLKHDGDNYQLHCLREGFDCQSLMAQLAQLSAPKMPPPITLNPSWQKKDYERAFHQTQTHLRAGDAYQINLTQSFHGSSSAPLSAYLPALHEATNAPYSGYCAVLNQEILSVSPELFLQFTKQNHKTIALSKPIKGTRPRHADQTLDQSLKIALQNSEKDLAENVMIVDLLRNDLGKYAKAGAVSTPIKFAIESFSNVHHMVSSVRAVIEEVPTLTVLFGSLPPGSVTGAPKKRACELIDHLEGKKRGAYCGTMGYINFGGDGQFNVLIRTLQSRQNNGKYQITLWAGGGITVLSCFDEEYQECFDKAGQILSVLKHPS